MVDTRRKPGTEHVDAVVVGSGFGGSVAAHRLAEAGRSVVLLERGRAYPPGSFARTPREMKRAFWDPSEGLHGLFDVWRFSGFDSVVSSGLGGGSLIYANVLLRKDERWFVREEPMPGGGYERWPISRADLDPHYDAVERMMGANPYPLHAPAFQHTAKTHAMIGAAERSHLPWMLPPLAVSFAAERGAEPALGVPITPPAYGNIHGAARRTCRLTGECDIGCNDGAKNTLDHTYLSSAAYHGADIRTRCEVRSIRPLDFGGYEVHYVRHEAPHPGADGSPDTPTRSVDTATLPTHRITCDRLILGAGAYGTTYLLLRNRAALPGLGAALGTRFCGNGDLLTFLLPKRQSVTLTREFDGSHGPVITSAIRVDDTVDGGAGRGFYIEDGGYPGFVDWLVESSDVVGNSFRVGEALVRWLTARITRSPQTHFSDEVSRVLSDGTLSAGSLPLLGMGRDVPDGVMKLRDGYLDVNWTTRTSAAYFGRVRDTMKGLADTLDAEYLDNPLWFFRRVVTVHPVGGAPMGRNDSEGVCDAFGEVYHHPGLYIADGSAMPGPVGTNPSLTIAAHSDRMATRMLETMPARRAGSRTGAARTSAARTRATGTVATGTVATATRATSLAFTEKMKGYFDFGTSDPATGEQAGRARGQSLMFQLTITADDMPRFLAEPEHLARADGWIACDALGGRLPVQGGQFNLFVPGDSADSRRMSYRLFFVDGGGNPLTLSGRKEVRDDSVLDVWLDTSTLFYLILPGHVSARDEPAAPVTGAGVAHIHPLDFAHQLTTFRTEGPRGAETLAEFGRFFMGELWDVYGRHTAATSPPPAEAVADTGRRR